MPTAWRTLAEIARGGERCLSRITAAVNAARRRVRAAIEARHGVNGFGHHPLLACCDNTAEPLAGMLWPGSAGSNTTADHITLVDEAIAALR